MSVRALSVLQWFGVFGAALAWAGQHIVGYGITEAECSSGGRSFGIGNDVWQISLMAATAAVILASEAAAIVVYRQTREVEEMAAPPLGRLHFFATAAIVSNVLFFGIVMLDGFASIFDTLCRQS